jgi:hypothetical protein
MQRHYASFSCRIRQRGGAVLAVIAGLLVVAASTMAIRMARQVEGRAELHAQTQARMQRIQAALHAFAASQGRLPCPADGAQDTGLAVPVAAAVMCTHRDGTVPWVSLGLQAEDALDGWGHKISYRVWDGATGLTQASGLALAGAAGLGVNDFGAPHNLTAWVLISHGSSGLGGWRVAAPRMPLPGAGSNEWSNTQAPPAVYFRRAEALVNPATGVEYAVNDAAHFDDMLWFESISDLKKLSGIEQVTVRLTTARLDSITPVAYTGRNANTTSITFDSATAWGDMTVASTGGAISRNAGGTGIGVCSGACATDAESALDNSKSLGFKLSGGKTAGKFALGVLSLDPTVQISFTFKLLGANVGVPVVYPALPSPPAAIVPYELTVVPNLMPSTATPFDEVVVQPLGTSRFFIASIRFCTAAENCN